MADATKKTEGAIACKWAADAKGAESPHRHIPLKVERTKIMDTILENVGNTPLVRLQRIPAEYGLECEILVKCEFFNAGGSVKDRIGVRMVLEAEREGRIQPGDTIIEPTSGNTGIGLALACAVRGYRAIITMPEKMSAEKVNVLRALGAEIIRTPTEAAWDAPESHISVAERLLKEIPNSHILNQYTNPNNPLAHYDGTAEELLWACDGKIDAVVAGAGTGGTISGIARKLKERCPECKIIAADPHGSILAQPESLNNQPASYHIEGIGYDFIPMVCERNLIDKWYKTDDTESFPLSRKLIREEGLLCGGSSGTALSTAIRAAKDLGLGKGKRIVVILPDSVRNYMSKFLSDDWMVKHGFLSPDDAQLSEADRWQAHSVAQLTGGDAASKVETVPPTTMCKEAVALLKAKGYDQLPVVDENNKVLGMVTVGQMLSKLSSGKVDGSDPVSRVLYKQFATVKPDTKLGSLSKIFDGDHFAVVCSDDNTIKSVVDRIDLVHYIDQYHTSVKK